MAYLKIIVTYLPELIDLIKWIVKETKNGILESQIKAKLKGITKALDNSNRPDAARQLNDLFRGGQ